jgi:hypothetical protein
MQKQLGVTVLVVLTGVVNLAGFFLSQNTALSNRSGLLALLCIVTLGMLYRFRQELPASRASTLNTRASFGLVACGLQVLAFCADQFPYRSAFSVSSSGLGLFFAMLLLMVLSAKPENRFAPE